MRKDILIGSILVLTLLLLMPSIPAIQKNVTEEEIKQNLQERLDKIDLKEINEFSKKLEWQFPILYILSLIIALRGWKGIFFMFISYTDFTTNPNINTILQTFFRLRGIWLFATASILVRIITLFYSINLPDEI